MINKVYILNLIGYLSTIMPIGISSTAMGRNVKK